ncbi:DUF3152 domain-containing protein [Brooklawnia sp.]|uniref:DUF3152 domain-containing protein n=1 Tax=Brooklawnia sp. TaxID=2699740 RepID=UPI00311EAB34
MASRVWTGLIVATLLLAGCGSGDDIPGTESVGPASTAASTQSLEPTPAVTEPTSGEPAAGEGAGTLTAIGPAPASIDADGMKHSGITGTGEFATNTIDIAPATQQPDVRRYVLQVETGTGVDPDETARQIQQILDSPRGWVGYHGVAFHLVNDPSSADLVLKLASPPTVDAGCGELDTVGNWNCRVGSQVFINSDRWWFATPTWEGYPLDDYRGYLINHEVGHYLGFGHLTCPADGEPSPVMQQQSIYLNGCVPNPWPDVTGEKNG